MAKSSTSIKSSAFSPVMRAVTATFPSPLPSHPRKWILRRFWLIDDFPEAHRTIGGEDNFTAPVGKGTLLGVAQVRGSGFFRPIAA